jgi:hypothetical protein
VVCVGALGRVSGQSQQPARADDVLPALLVEVKGLRAAMEEMASAGPRAQLFMSRLQLQEGRIAGMNRRLDTVRDNLANARRDLERFKGSIKMLETDANKPGVPHDEDTGAALALTAMKGEIASGQSTVDRLAAEEQQLSQDLSVEQARWIEINQRLDELERALVKK